MTTQSPSEIRPDNVAKRSWFGWWWEWITPRSENRDEAFRERTIRVTVAGLLIVLTSVLLSSLNVPTVQGTIINYWNITLAVWVLVAASGIAVARRKVVTAGQLLVAAIMIASIGITVIDDAKYTGPIVLPLYMEVVLVTGLVLPRSRLLPISALTVLIYSIIALLQFQSGYRPPQFNQPDSTVLIYSIQNVFFIIAVEVFFLSRLRVEFDERLTDVRRSYQQAEEARQDADRANQAKSRFLASMSHEFRTPLNAIIGYIDIMVTGMAGDNPEQRNRMHTHIRDNATRLLASINDTLDMARIESGRVRIDVSELSPRELIDSMVGSMNSLAQKKGIYLKAEWGDNVPETVVCDKTKLQQVLTNLIGNALKFTHEGGVTVAVTGTGEGQWQFTVTDTGIGMPEDAGNYVFEAFRQVEDDDRRKYEGTGLGLAITKRWVTLMGGTIDLKTAPGKGSSFVVTLPRVGTEGEATDSATQERQAVTTATR